MLLVMSKRGIISSSPRSLSLSAAGEAAGAVAGGRRRVQGGTPGIPRAVPKPALALLTVAPGVKQGNVGLGQHSDF